MNLVNLAHGSLYMVGAYLAVRPSRSDRLLLARRSPSALPARCVVGIAIEVIAAAHALRPRSPRPGARHLRPDPVLQRARARSSGAARRCTRDLPAALPATSSSLAGLALPASTALAIIAVGLARGGAALCTGHAHAARHADPRRRLQPRHGRRARRQHPPALHAWCSALGAALAALAGADGRADLRGAARAWASGS